MYTKKEIIITILCILAGTLLIYFLPTIEKKLSHRRIYEYEEKEEKAKQIEKYVCTFASNSNVISRMLEATFYIDGNNVTRIYTKESNTYKKKEDYENAAAVAPKSEKKDNIEVKTTIDNVNWTIVVARGENITDHTTSTYPLNLKELQKYLEKNKYTCTIRYKK